MVINGIEYEELLLKEVLVIDLNGISIKYKDFKVTNYNEKEINTVNKILNEYKEKIDEFVNKLKLLSFNNLNEIINENMVNVTKPNIANLYKTIQLHRGNLGKIRIQFKREHDYIFDTIEKLMQEVIETIEKLPRDIK